MSNPEVCTIPEVFESRKRKILADLSVPDTEYTDLSPKGSVDEGIRDLIRDINALPGLVTTSSSRTNGSSRPLEAKAQGSGYMSRTIL